MCTHTGLSSQQVNCNNNKSTRRKSERRRRRKNDNNRRDERRKIGYNREIESWYRLDDDVLCCVVHAAYNSNIFGMAHTEQPKSSNFAPSLSYARTRSLARPQPYTRYTFLRAACVYIFARLFGFYILFHFTHIKMCTDVLNFFPFRFGFVVVSMYCRSPLPPPPPPPTTFESPSFIPHLYLYYSSNGIQRTVDAHFQLFFHFYYSPFAFSFQFLFTFFSSSR